MVSTVEAGRLVITPHPLTLEGQTNTPADLRAGESLLSFLERHVPNLHTCKYAVYVNGGQVAPEFWARVKPKHGTIIAVRSVVEKQALQLVAIAALTYFTFGIGTGAYSGIIAAKFGSLAATAVFMGGSMLINKVLAPSVPKLGTNGFKQEDRYKIAPSNNAARQHEALPILLGSVRYAPDYASLPYTWYEGNEQYLGAIFNAGLNVDRFEGSLFNGNTELSSYQDVDVWANGFVGMQEQDIPLFTNPDAVDGGELKSGIWVTRVTSLDTIRIQSDFEIQLYSQGKKGMEAGRLEIEGRYRKVGDEQWINLPTRYLSNSSTAALRVTESFSVPAGQYEVAWRNASWDGTEDGKHVVKPAWTQMLSMQIDDGDYAGQSRVGIKIKATGQLNGSLQEIKGDFFACAMPVWNGNAWAQATNPDNGLSNPGAQILLLARGIYVADPKAPGGRRLVAGMGLPDDQIDIEGLKAFMLHCAANNLRHDALISDDRSNLDLLSQIARCGLGSFGYFNGKWGVVWAWDNQPINGVVNMANIKKSTFKVSYTLASSADGIVYTYLNRETWEQDSIYVYAPGKTTMLNPARVTGEGITNTEHAAIMARYHLGQSLFQFKDIGYETDLEHLDYQRMSVLQISHDMTQWGRGGRLTGATKDEHGVVTIHLDAPVPDKSIHDDVEETEPFVGLRIPGEAVYRVFKAVRPAAGAFSLQLKDPWPKDAMFPGDHDDNPAHDTTWYYDFKPTPGARVRVAGMQMQSGLGGAEVSVVPESDEFWNYVLNGTYEPAGNDSQLSRDETPLAKNLRITEQQVVQGNTQFTELTVTFDVSGEMVSAEVWAAPEGHELKRVADTFTRQATFRIDAAGNWMVQVRPMGHTRAGPAATVFYATKAADMPPWNYDSLLITEIAGGLRRYAFEYLEGDSPLDLAGAEIRYLAGTHAAPAWDNMTPLGAGFYTAAFESVLPAEGVWTFALRARNTSGQLSIDPLVRTVKLGKNFDQAQTKDKTPPPAVTGLAVAAGLGTAIVSWNPAAYDVGHGHARTVIYAAKGDKAAVSTAKKVAESYSGPASFSVVLGETWRVWAKHESVDGVLSSKYAGPVSVTVGKVGDADLADDLDIAKRLANGSVTAEKIAEGALDASKFAQGVEPVTVVPDADSLPTKKVTSSILWKGTLYAWNATAKKYEKAVADVETGTLGADKFKPGTEPVTTIPDNGSLPTTKVTTNVSWKGTLYAWNATAKKYEKAVADVAAGSIGLDKFEAGVEPVKVIPKGEPLPTKKSATTISWNGALYSWNADSGKYEELKASLSGEVGGNNLCRDSSFELAFAAVPNLWSNYSNGAENTSLSRFDEGRLVGKSRVTIVGATVGTTLGCRISNAALTTFLGSGYKGGVPYVLSFYAKKANGSRMTTAGFRWNSPQPATVILQRPSLSVDWQRYVFQITFAADKTAELFISADGTFATGDEIWIDDVQIEEGTVVTAYAPHPSELLPGSVGGVFISDDAITAEKIVAGAIVAGKLGVNAVAANNIQANAVTVDKLAANSVTAAKIVAGAVGADHLQANSVTASKLVVADFTNLITNSQLIDEDAWKLDSEVSRVNSTSSSDISPGAFLIGENISGNRYARFQRMPVTAGASYLLSAYYRSGGNLPRSIYARMGVTWFTKDGAQLPSQSIINPDRVSSTAPVYVEGVVIAPETAAYAQCIFGRVAGEGEFGPAYISLPSFRSRAGGSLIVDGSISTEKLTANAVTADKLAANSVTAAKIVAGAIGADHLQANSITADKMLISSPSNILPDTQSWTEAGAASSWVAAGFVRNVAGGYVYLQHKKVATLDTLFDVRKDTEYLFTMDVRGDTNNARQYFELVKEDGSQFTPRLFMANFASNNTVNFEPFSASFVAPESARVRLKVYANDNQTSTTGGYVRFRAPTLRAMAQGELIVDGSIAARHLTVNSVTSDHVTANAITAAKIAAGAVGADQVAANAITTRHLVVADWSNLHPDPDLIREADTDLWTIPAWVSAAGPNQGAGSWSDFSSGTLAASSPNPGTAWSGASIKSGNVSVQGGKDYVISFRHRRYGVGTSNIRCVVYFYDGSGERISGSDKKVSSSSTGTTPDEVLVPFTAPSKATSIAVFYQQNPNSTSGFIIGDMSIRRAASAELIVDGAITANKLAANSVVAGKLAANSVAAANIIAGAITADALAAGAVTTPKLAAGSVDASKLTANSVTAEKLAANSVTAAKIAANAVTADHLRANSVDASKLTANAVTAEKVAANAITTPKLAAGSVTADKMQVGTITAESGIIAHAAITTATIGEAQVDTLRIKGEAVSINRFSESTARWSAHDYSQQWWHDLLYISIPESYGAQIIFDVWVGIGGYLSDLSDFDWHGIGFFAPNGDEIFKHGLSTMEKDTVSVGCFFHRFSHFNYGAGGTYRLAYRRGTGNVGLVTNLRRIHATILQR
ncbi:hypothetical protein E4695_04190 [Alcaligenaceae bacterium 429]|nr:hypothetical protein E4695_04190 [Alcaligenaceae bacterium 429]